MPDGGLRPKSGGTFAQNAHRVGESEAAGRCCAATIFKRCNLSAQEKKLKDKACSAITAQVFTPIKWAAP